MLLTPRRRPSVPRVLLRVVISSFALAVLSERPVIAQGVDPSPRAMLIAVADSVQLEVLDWGGKGPTLILLAGMGHSAHVFDGFVRRLTPHLHVMGITRRGFGASSRPRRGFDSTTLVHDLIAVLDSLGLQKASFAGHSFAASEMSILAARFPERGTLSDTSMSEITSCIE